MFRQYKQKGEESPNGVFSDEQNPQPREGEGLDAGAALVSFRVRGSGQNAGVGPTVSLRVVTGCFELPPLPHSGSPHYSHKNVLRREEVFLYVVSPPCSRPADLEMD